MYKLYVNGKYVYTGTIEQVRAWAKQNLSSEDRWVISDSRDILGSRTPQGDILKIINSERSEKG